MSVIACAAVALTSAPTAGAESADQALNGTYQAVSNGDWAKTDGVYRDEVTAVSTWTIESSCSDPQTCTGTVTSDQGWTADLKFQSQSWWLRRTLEAWQQCPDGSTGNGHQLFRFYPIDRAEASPGSPILAGEDTTTGDPGACGRGYPTEIRMPFRLTKLS